MRKDNKVVLIADGQVTMGDHVMKHSARKTRRLYNDKVIVGFAGSTADAISLFERFEGKLQEHSGNLAKAAVELAKEWRKDRALRHLEALLIVADTAGGLHLVRADAGGVSREIMTGIDLTRRMAEIRFEQVAAEPLAGDGDALARLRDAGWVILAADTLGACDVMIEKAVAVQREGLGFSFVEILTMCPTGWFIETEEAPAYLDATVAAVHAGGVLKDVTATP